MSARNKKYALCDHKSDLKKMWCNVEIKENDLCVSGLERFVLMARCIYISL